MSSQTITIPVAGMSCVNCAANIEKTLNSKVEGIFQASVNFASEQLTVEYIPSQISMQGIRSAVKKIGYDVIAADDESKEDAEEIARKSEIRNQAVKFAVGVGFALPLFILSMLRDFSVIGQWSHAPWVNWFFFIPGNAYPVLYGR